MFYFVERRPVLSFMTVYEPASSMPVEDDDELDDEDRSLYKLSQPSSLKRLHSPTKNVSTNLPFLYILAFEGSLVPAPTLHIQKFVFTLNNSCLFFVF